MNITKHLSKNNLVFLTNNTTLSRQLNWKLHGKLLWSCDPFWPIRVSQTGTGQWGMIWCWSIVWQWRQMNNYTFYIEEADTRPVVQQPHGDIKDVAPWKRVSVLDQHECWQRQPAFIANIIKSQRLLSMNGTPIAPPNLGVIYPLALPNLITKGH